MNIESVLDRLRDFANPRQENVSSLGRWLAFTWRNRITATGRMLLLLLLVAGPVSAAIGVYVPLYFFSVFIFCLLLIGRLGGLIFGPRVEISRRLPERCAAGAELRVQAQVRNTGPLGVFDLAASEHMPHLSIRLPERPEHLDFLPSGGGATLTYTLLPTLRGVYDFRGPVAMTAFPFGVYYHARTFREPQRMLVYPRFMRLEALELPVGRKHQPGGLQMASNVGDSEEFLGNREYRPGDRLRDVHHAAWARRGYPVVREFQQEYLCRIAMIVDTHIARPGWQARMDLEAALSLAAAVADVLSRREYVIDIFAAGPDLYHFQAGRSLAYLDNILDILACIQPCRESPFSVIAPAIMEEISQISTAVMVFLDWNEEREAFVRSIRAHGVAVKVLMARSVPPSFDPSGFFTEAGPVQALTAEQIEAGVDRL